MIRIDPPLDTFLLGRVSDAGPRGRGRRAQVKTYWAACDCIRTRDDLARVIFEVGRARAAQIRHGPLLSFVRYSI